MRKILVINTIGIGREGISSVIYNYCSNMDQKGLTFSFLSPSAWVLTEDVKKQFQRIGKIYVFPDRRKETALYLKKLKQLLKKESFDVIHIHGNSGTMFLETFIARLCRVKKIMVHCHNTVSKYPKLNKILRIPMMWMATDLLACSNEAGRFLYGERKFTVLNNAIDSEKYKFNETIRKKYRKKFGIEEDEFVVGHAGNFNKQKNHDFLIDVFDELHKSNPKCKLLLLSDGELKEEIENKVNYFGLSEYVIFAGRREDIAECYQAMDIFVLPSLWEGLPVVMLEAQAAGLPIIVSDNITHTAKCTEYVYYLNLEEGKEAWAGKIELVLSDLPDRTNGEIKKLIQKHGFEIKKQSQVLKEMYLEWSK